METKSGFLLVYFELPCELNTKTWVACNIVIQDNVLTIKKNSDDGTGNFDWSKTFTLSPEWLIISSPLICPTSKNIPPFPHEKHQALLFGLTKPPDVVAWFLANTKSERDEWIEELLSKVQLKFNLPVASAPPPPYSPYDNCLGYEANLLPVSDSSNKVTFQSSTFKRINNELPVVTQPKSSNVQIKSVKKQNFDENVSVIFVNDVVYGAEDATTCCNLCCPFCLTQPSAQSDLFLGTDELSSCDCCENCLGECIESCCSNCDCNC